eukprot:4997182-Prymnesium_polylepis.2
MTSELSTLLAQLGALTSLIQQLPQSVASQSAAALREFDHQQEVLLQKQQARQNNSALVGQMQAAKSMRALGAIPG